ncbi:RHS repeat domain-containing protein [Haliscomenobacter hydrossis]|uniref:RHS repeat-associated core domain protein n=1 Tax=Haliscomenobacter hydrossis (strain ATCC 27775 / DSM 1100 / LMG 10767 / O) TaxID=760192 RepID=F4KYT4_HALH1|nr:RHS repeat-associated core domain-containing protein [Haliscomenobacter hydrossis]AEE51476.1 RHS repeat-associated core domain protein [Haliscomenobacter hydrossis DSM 1100]
MKTNPLHTLVVLITTMVCTISSWAQPVNLYINDVSMPTPNAASLGKYTEVPVSHFTGATNTSIPIYTLREGSLNLSVSLNYHSSGLKMGEPAAWVGTGWNLDAGGSITRTVVGIKDEETGDKYGYYTYGLNPPSGLTNQHIAEGILDSEPDIFTFSFPGYTGKFYFFSAGNYQIVPKQDLKIEPVGSFDYFKITTPQGLVYYFGGSPDSDPAYDETTYESNIFPKPKVRSSWHLVKIESPDKKHAIKFEYAEEKYVYKSLSSVARYKLIGQAPDGSCASEGTILSGDLGNIYYTTTTIDGKRLFKIYGTSQLETLQFNATTDREDLDPDGTNKAKRLEDITLSTGSGSSSSCTKWLFAYDYFVDNSSTCTTGNFSYCKRLKLKELKHQSCYQEELEEPYKFEYEGYDITVNGQTKQYLPSRFTRAIDRWGYYNGAHTPNESSYSVPNVPPTTIQYNFGSYAYGNSNRTTSEAHMRYGALKKVTYPTGGHTSLVYEANECKELVSVYAREYIVDSLSNCYQANGICCAATQPSTTATFTSNAEIAADSFNLEITNTYCGSPQYCYAGPVSVSVEIRYNGNNQLLTVYNFNLAPGMSYGKIAQKLSHMYNGFQPGIAYKFVLCASGGRGIFSIFKPGSTNQYVSSKVGGLRIKEIRAHDGVNTANDVIKTYDYKHEGGTESSGKLFYKPNYGYVLTVINNQGGNWTYYYHSDEAIVPLSTYNGYHVGYQRVVENLNGNGKVVYTYDTEELPYVAPTYPYTPEKAVVARGQMLSETTRNAGDQILTQTSIAKNNDTYSEPVELKKVIRTKLCGSWMLYSFAMYRPRTAPYRIANETVAKDGINTTTTYTYANVSAQHLAPITSAFTNSDGKTSVTNYYYAHEMSNRSGASPVYAELKNRNMITIPLEETESIAGVQVKGSRAEYGFFNSSGNNVASGGSGIHPYPYKFWNYEMTWNASNMVSISGSDGWVLRGTINSYHPDSGSGKAYPKQFTQTGWSPETYEWQNGLITQKTYRQHTQTYTYIPGTRLLASSTSVDGQLTEFVYDKLMRLKEVKSRFENNIPKVITTYTYGYKNAQNPRNFVKSITTFTAVSNSNLTSKGMVQYFDGLGRLIQDVKIKHQPNKGADGQGLTTFDVAVNYTYDNRGRLISTSNPFVGAAQDGSYATIPGSWPTVTTQYETSPLGRPIANTSQLGYATLSSYGSNQSTITTPNGISYNANTLYETKITDPDNRVSYSYTDKRGRLVLSRQTNTSNTSPADTYTAYDDKDRVKEVYPPGTVSSNAELIFKYLYDVADNTIYKKVPDAAAVQFRYDTRDLPVYMQDGNLAAQSKCLKTQYDLYGRAIKTGFWNGFPTTINPADTFAINDVNLLTITHYDGFDGSTTQTGAQYKGRVRRSMVKVLDYTPTTWLDAYYTYDAHGRLTVGNSNNLLNPSASSAESSSFSYDWADNVISETRTHTTGGAAATLPFNTVNQYQYDGNGRKINFITTIGGVGQHVAEYNYNYRDELIERNLHANEISGAWAWLQSIDYSYNTQGWLTGINNWNASATIGMPAVCTPAMPNPSSPARTTYNEGSDLIYMHLLYDQTFSGVTGSIQKGGNIAQLAYRVRGRETTMYSYAYDYLSRLSSATLYEYSDAAVLTNSNKYNESLTYDLRGNIQTLQRTGFYQNGGSCTYGQIDNLTYSYPTSPASNKVHKILDGTTTAGDAKSRGFNGLLSTADNSLTYDANGNLNKNLHKNISSITYNHLNLPKLITFSTGNSIEFLYDATGTKLRKTTKVGATVQYIQDYLPNGIEYRQTGTGVKRVESVYHAEGRYYNTNVDAADAIVWRKEYNFRDYLGNTRLAFTDRNANGIVDITGTASTSDVLQENHYYPFGLAFEGPWLQNDAGVRDNKYQYSQKELNDDFGLGWLDFGARWYDASIGKWGAVDPLSEDAPAWTPYRYAFNNPLIYVDPDGLFEDENAARKYAEENDIKLRPKSFIGMLFTSGKRSQIVKNADGTFSIDNRSENSSISDLGGELGVATAALVTANDIMSVETKGDIFFGETKTATLRDGSLMDVTPLGGTVDAGGPGKALKGAKLLKELPKLDRTGKVHGILPRVKDLVKYGKDELSMLLKELKKSVRRRIQVTSRMGRDRAHGQRQGAEQDLIKSLEKHLRDRK